MLMAMMTALLENLSQASPATLVLTVSCIDSLLKLMELMALPMI